MAQPILTWTLNWGNNTAQKLSGKTYVNPSGTTVDCTQVGVTFQSSVNFNKFYATAVKDGNDYGFVNDVLIDIEGSNPTGIKIHELTSRAAATDFTFTITTSHLTQGEGQYRIGLYTQGTDGFWNYEYFFVTTEADTTHKQIILSDSAVLQVPVKTSVG